MKSLFELLLAVSFTTLPGTVARAREPFLYLGFLGDGGTGKKDQRAVAHQLELARSRGALDVVFLLGDNIYEKGQAKYIKPKYLDVYDGLLDEIEFHAALGNHDVKKCKIVEAESLPRGASAYRGCEVDEQLDPANRFGFEGGHRYYRVSLEAAADAGPAHSGTLVDVFVLDTNTLSTSQTLLDGGDDRLQLEWLEGTLAESRAVWKVVVMHHPMHSPKASGWFKGHRREERLAAQLEPILSAGGVDVVFAGHNHFYARMVPQHGIRYFVSGGGGKGVYRHDPDEGYVVADDARGKFYHFVLVRVSDDKFEYCTVDANGTVRDGGWFQEGDVVDTLFAAGFCPF